MHTITFKGRFEASHFLPRVPIDHKCRRLHGHSYRAVLEIGGPLHPVLGWVVDFAEVRKAWEEHVYSRLDHRTLNEVAGLSNATSEVLARWIFDVMAPVIAGLGHEVRLVSVKVSETEQTWAKYVPT